jgi:hypothetical protein
VNIGNDRGALFRAAPPIGARGETGRSSALLQFPAFPETIDGEKRQ